MARDRFDAVPGAVVRVLEEAQRRGFVGPGDLVTHLRHALAFLEVLTLASSELLASDVLVDLGSGAGLPGLVIAPALSCRVLLLEGSSKRSAWLLEAVDSTGLSPRVEVVPERAEVVGRRGSSRAQASVVVARAFGRPAEVAECGAPLLRLGGMLVVSEPPGGMRDRWPAGGVEQLGLVRRPVEVRGGAHFAVFQQESECPANFPRRVGVPRKRPLF